ncbi:hypothetical protein MPL3356_350016 [Mesorhizobium plurifarium]|uniref:Uncharacterized protein n=1 Tax=Mesorhizobium plurifarium TaxID=69974 RepID=A0A090DW44_MESPL|nr:hypothetical protein MPL3356_350016 [Mesorhizobium plurifarium]
MHWKCEVTETAPKGGAALAHDRPIDIGPALKSLPKSLRMLHKSLHKPLRHGNYISVFNEMRKGYSVSKTAGRRFEPCCPCHLLESGRSKALPVENRRVACHMGEIGA